MDFHKIEQKWQEKWEAANAFKSDLNQKKKKFYCLEMFPYPSGSGLHMGHAFNYTIGDIYARFKRMSGFNVLYPMGYDSFGLPAENAAIKAKSHPRVFTDSAISNFIRQQKSLGLSYDWSRMVKTSSHEYYKWNQFIFLKFLENGLVCRKNAQVNWCPECCTVLANEQVHDGKCWRHTETEVEKKELEQWFIKTTKYAEELLSEIPNLEWPERIKAMQEHWIGKSTGAELFFDVVDGNGKKIDSISTFTTRPDTAYGITYLVIAAEHPKALEWSRGTSQEKKVLDFVNEQKKRSIIDRTAEGREKNGVFTGRHFINPFTGGQCPIWVADYALYEYGTGAVMAVPTHDQRDFEFAKKYNLPLKVVISPSSYELNPLKMSRAYIDDGVLVNSGDFDGMDNREAIAEIGRFAEKKGWGKIAVNYKLRDWLVSRQRYWGTPIPVIHCKKCGAVPVPYDELPVLLPEDVEFGKGNPIETSREFANAKCPKCKGSARRETDTMDTFFDSSWYFLRYTDSSNSSEMFDRKKAEYWMPVDQYIGGAEHACMHLIYARFFVKALRDLGYVSFSEPFKRLFNQGMLHGADGFVMSKSRGNVVLPEEISEKYGIDTARFFLVSIASPDKDLEWSDAGIEGSFRFMKKVAKYFEEVKLGSSSRMLESKLHKAIKGVTEDIENFRYNLAVIKIRELFDALEPEPSKEVLGAFLKLLHPFCPHITEEFWEKLGSRDFISLSKWPDYDEKKIDLKAEALEQVVLSARSDIIAVQQLTKIAELKKAKLIVAASWKYDFAAEMRKQLAKSFNQGEAIKGIMQCEKLKTHGSSIAKLVPKIMKDPSKLPQAVFSQKDEISCLESAKDVFEKEFNAKFEIESEEKSKEQKASSAMPGRPAIVLG